MSFTACHPKGSRQHLVAALEALALENANVRDLQRHDAIERIDELAVAFNGQCRGAKDAPSIKDVRDRLLHVASAMDGAARALKALDDASVDWLLGRVDEFLGLTFAASAPANPAEISAAFGLQRPTVDDEGSDDGASPRQLSRADMLSPAVSQLTAARIVSIAGEKLSVLRFAPPLSGPYRHAVQRRQPCPVAFRHRQCLLGCWGPPSRGWVDHPASPSGSFLGGGLDASAPRPK
jgi:hypothetical protein